jgi:hypothetical protein
VQRDPHALKIARTVLEVWLLNYCSELPSSGAEGFTVSVQNNNGSWSNTGWSGWSYAGIPVKCNYRESSVGANHAYLFWNP